METTTRVGKVSLFPAVSLLFRRTNYNHDYETKTLPACQAIPRLFSRLFLGCFAAHPPPEGWKRANNNAARENNGKKWPRVCLAVSFPRQKFHHMRKDEVVRVWVVAVIVARVVVNRFFIDFRHKREYILWRAVACSMITSTWTVIIFNKTTVVFSRNVFWEKLFSFALVISP